MNLPLDDRPTILVVDDERLNRNALAEMLGVEYRVLLAKDGPGALAHAQREAAQLLLILLDVSMPGMSGYDVLGALRADERTAGIAVIFITGQSDDAAEEYGLNLGAADYVSKPIRPAIVRVRVRNQIHLALQKRALERLAQIDGLTGLANRRHFDAQFDRAWRRCERAGIPLGLALVDIDHFKQYNDRYGHLQGDEALRTVAQTLQAHARRPDDLAARIGGEEFTLLMPGDELLVQRIEDFRQAVVAQAIPHADSSTGPTLTVSCGLVVAHQLDRITPTDLLQKADTLLYTAKFQGRNRTVTWTQT